MAAQHTCESYFFYVACLYNFGILGVVMLSKKHPGKVDSLFDSNGVCAVLLWGAAYASAAVQYKAVPALMFVFFVEKLFYFAKWVSFWMAVEIPVKSVEMTTAAIEVPVDSAAAGARCPWKKVSIAWLKEDPPLNTFFMLYGLGDFVFGVFFFYCGVSALL